MAVSLHKFSSGDFALDTVSRCVVKIVGPVQRDTFMSLDGGRPVQSARTRVPIIFNGEAPRSGSSIPSIYMFNPNDLRPLL